MSRRDASVRAGLQPRGRLRLTVRSGRGDVVAERHASNLVLRRGAAVIAGLFSGAAGAVPINRLKVGFATEAWRLGDALIGLPWLRRFAGVPPPLIALLGASLIYIAWQVPYAGTVAVLLAFAYALGAVVTARLQGSPQAVSAH